MGSYQYERLSGQDMDFLKWETPNLPMHVAGVSIFEAGPLRNEHGGIDADKIKQLTESVMHMIPRYRQKLKWIPGTEQAVWIDDEYFNIDYHIRHTSLPRPGTHRQLCTLVSRLMEQQLDRARPLWETWVVEGLEGDRFATVIKIHHCMVDGASGVQLSQLLFSTEPTNEPGQAPRFIPRPEPTDAELKRSQLQHRLMGPVELASDVVKFARDAEDLTGEVLDRAKSLAGIASWKANPVSSTPVNGTIGPHRIVEWTSMSLDDMKAVRRALDCKINDVVLTVVTGAFRRLMQRRQVRPESLEFRVSAPVNARKEGEGAEVANHVSSWVLRLPLGLDDPVEQLEAIKAETRQLKKDHAADAVELVVSLVERLGISVQDMSVGTVNTIVTNVPGPPFPLYLLGSELKQMIPLAPLLDNLGISIGALSYNGRVSFGLSADYDRLPDLTEFCRDLELSFERLAEGAGVELNPPPALEAGTPQAAPVADAAEAVEPITVEPPTEVRH